MTISVAGLRNPEFNCSQISGSLSSFGYMSLLPLLPIGRCGRSVDFKDLSPGTCGSGKDSHVADLVKTYQDAVKHRDQAFGTLKRLREPIIKVAGALMRNPREFSFENSNVVFPKPLPHSGVYVTDWHPADDIQRALSECHRAVIEVEAAWAGVPDRAGLQAPGDPWTALGLGR
jgi:hypothetical protein